MLYGIVSAGFQDVIEPQHITLDVSIRVGDGIPYSRLRAEVDHDVWMVLLKDAVNQGLVRQIALDKGVILKLLKFSQTRFLNSNVIVVVHVIQTDDLRVRLCSKDAFRKV